MATLAFSLAGQMVGGLVGGPIGATVGRALGALAGSAVDGAIFGARPEPVSRTGADIRLQGSSEGGAVPRLYGWARVTGNIIWATELEEISGTASGGKGFLAPRPPEAASEPTIVASFAVALCEGEVQRLGRIWADGQPLETEGLSLRFYRGTQTQGPDSLIEAKQGPGGAPAYRGLCYLVFERLPLGAFGNRIPNISVELCRVVGELEPAIRAVTVIPGASEFGYDPEPRVRLVGPGRTGVENTHLSREVSDWTLSIDELTALCPNLEHVALVVAWFGDDLRCGNCTIRPRVESAGRAVSGPDWQVAGQGRGSVPVVSTHAGGPAYGGTPSDGAVRAAIADLRERGLKVTLYPLVMMDIPAGNALENPYGGGAGQPAYPWRGRITCAPAPGREGSPDTTAGVAAQVSAFLGTGSDWRFRRFVRHYASLAVAAGGVDGFVIGSEMRGMSFLRDGGNGFPFVAGLVGLAGEVRTILGGGTAITYAADWSEFSGLQPEGSPGEKFFHLDPLWASDAIDAVGIDNYMPLTDWRDGEAHANAEAWGGLYDRAYLKAGIAGGEGYDWYYASLADRIAGVRTPIADGVHGEPWIWRFKDLRNWWANAHHDRPGGVRASEPTAWVPRGKPIWFTELGCAAVDKGPNQPNVFGDPKSAESGRPWFSSGAPDPLVQRQFLRAQLEYWGEAENNPVSEIYGGPMLDPDRIYLWTWDARPFPAFPANVEAWSDGPNHLTGHWLTGRLGALAGDELIAAIGADYGIDFGALEAEPPLIHGMLIETVAGARDALAPVLSATGASLHDHPEGLAVARATPKSALSVTRESLVADEGALVTRRRPDPSEALGRLSLAYADRERDYLTGTVTAAQLEGAALGTEGAGLVLDLVGARGAAERMLADRMAGRETIELTLPHSLAGIEPGDVIAPEGEVDGPFEVTEIRDGAARRITARGLAGRVNAAIVTDRPRQTTTAPSPRAMPLLVLAHLPGLPGSSGETRVLAAALAEPWPGDVVVTDALTGTVRGRIGRSAVMGELVEPLGPGRADLWDRANQPLVRLYAGHLAARAEVEVLSGANRLLLETDDGHWEVIGFAEALLEGPGLYRLRGLLRGLEGTDHAIGTAGVGRRIVFRDEAVASWPIGGEWLDQAMSLRLFAGRDDIEGTPASLALTTAPALPLAPVHLRARREMPGGAVRLSWVRRSRAETDGWSGVDAPLDLVPEAYRVTILDDEGRVVRTLEAGGPSVIYGEAEQITDFGALPTRFDFAVRQVSPVLGGGHEARGEFDG
ncbi:hypothetical protein EMQ25_08910 [Arsenicitalea aurantiaca]|uniref:Host specificity protein n=1 Tax=Arsenicitalea aurantiaca TaxID=1783274 RepID=A0A433XAC3_9HYPH|nr:glycoside hydrolase/phage tail family protein [Arsenicitalea aurantiaca]RUT30990.1 hypothetical protein EMQ25_08910 [Arsenicitalea aurantiaca]